MAAAAAGTTYRWLSRDPRTGQEVRYEPDLEQKIEAQFQTAGCTAAVVNIGQIQLTIDFAKGTQVTNTGGLRYAWREPREEPRYASQALESLEDVGLDCSPEWLRRQLALIDRVDTRVMEVQNGQGSLHFCRRLGTEEEIADMMKVYRHMMISFRGPLYRGRYGFIEHTDKPLFRLQEHQQVPTYWANASDGQTVWRRKMLSLAGLRNLIIYGPEIFGELQEKHFSGCPDDYPHGAPGGGMHKMKYYTGNAVDLDTTVLRCHDPVVFRTVNEQNRKQGLPEHPTPDSFGSSQQARDIAIASSEPLIEAFCQEFKLTPQQRVERRLELSKSRTQVIPLAVSNTDRGKHPLWQYINDGVNSFHCNVPNMPDVYGGLVRAPWHLAKAYLTILLLFPEGSPERAEWMKQFFSEAVADSCFNAKWKNIEAFCESLEKLGSIRDHLEKLQRDHQSVFSPLFDKHLPEAEEASEEVKLLWQLAEGAEGRDKAGQRRPITREDCEFFVSNPGQDI